MAINIAFNTAATIPTNNIIRPSIPAITVHGTGQETGAARIVNIVDVIAAATGVPTDGNAPSVVRTNRSIVFNQLALRISGNVVVDMSGYNVDFIGTNLNGWMTCYGFNANTPGTVNNGQAGIITNQCNITWINTSLVARDFPGPFFLFSTWEGTDCTINLSAGNTTTNSNWDAPGRQVTFTLADGTPTAGDVVRDNPAGDPIWTINNVLMTDGNGYDWGPAAASNFNGVLNASSSLQNFTLNTSTAAFAGGTFPGFSSVAYISGLNRDNNGSEIYLPTIINDGASTNPYTTTFVTGSPTGAWQMTSRDTPFEFRNYDFGPSWASADNDRIRISQSGSRTRTAGVTDVWHRWLYDWNITFQESNGMSNRVNTAPFDVFVQTGNLNNNADNLDAQTNRVTTNQLWAGTTVNSQGLPAWTPAVGLANPGGLTRGQLSFAGTEQTNIPLPKYWTNGANVSGQIYVQQLTRYDALFAYYPFDSVVFDNRTIEPRNVTPRTTDGINFNNPIPVDTQTVSVHAGITEEDRSVVAAYPTVNRTSQAFDKAWYDKIELVNAANTYATKVTANNADPMLLFNTNGNLTTTLSANANIRLMPGVHSSSQPLVVNGNTLEIYVGTDNEFLLEHNIEVAGSIITTGVNVLNPSGFALIDGNAPLIEVTGAPAGVITQFYDNTNGTLASSPFHTITGNGSFDRSLPAFTESITAIRAVTYGAGFTARVVDLPENPTISNQIGVGSRTLDASTLVPQAYPSSALSSSSIAFTETGAGTNRVFVQSASYDAANNRLTVSVEGTLTMLTDAQLNDWVQKAVKVLPEYGRVVAHLNAEFITSSGGSGVAESTSDRIRFTPGTTTNQTWNFGYLANPGGSPASYNTPRTLTLQGGGTSAINVGFAGTPSTFDGAVVDVAIANADLATRSQLSSTIAAGVQLNSTGESQVAVQVRRNA